jgi:hypothetical protein
MQQCSCYWYCQYLSIALNDGVMVNWSGCGRKWSWFILRHCPGIRLESLKKMIEHLCQNSQCHSQNWNRIQARSFTAWVTLFAHSAHVTLQEIGLTLRQRTSSQSTWTLFYTGMHFSLQSSTTSWVIFRNLCIIKMWQSIGKQQWQLYFGMKTLEPG